MPTELKERSSDWIRSNLDTLLTEKQDPEIVKRVCTRVSEILTTGETILYVAVQKKLVVNFSPDCVVLTNRRFIAYRPKLLGRVSFEDYVWRDLRDARLKEGVIGATLTLETVAGEPIAIDHLPKAQARRLYAFAQEMEEKVREERRMRELEEKRAAAGGIVMNTAGKNVGIEPMDGTRGETDPAERLKRLKQMLDAGLITQGEYESKRADIIARM